MMKHFLLCVLSLITATTLGQTPNIGLTYTSDSVSEGYTLFSPDGQGEVYLIDNCGRIINHWSFDETPGLTHYILDNGNLLYAGKDSLHIRDWNNNRIWTYATTVNGIRQHHDIEPLPNGNILCIAGETKTQAEQTAAGKDPALLGVNFKLDKIVELEPVGDTSANIVWEWHFWDHLIQEYDSTKLNYGVVADHPELLDFNYDQGNTGDWTHVNGVDYNADLDQIILSSRQFSEVYIIDHSTTTAEAASHTGGNSGKGGDFLWRWGNPQVYQQGAPVDQKLFRQHHPEWVENGFVNAGKISVFNNDGEDGAGVFSSIHLIEPTMSGNDYVLTGNLFGPTDYFYTWNGTQVSPVMYSDKKSGVKALRDGGFLICETEGGRFIEIHADGSVVWQYDNPLGGGGIFNQGDLSANGNNPAFRAMKYLPNHPGIAVHSISAGNIIEDQNTLSDGCVSDAGLSFTDLLYNIRFVNPAKDNITFIDPLPNEGKLTLVNIQGHVKQTWEMNGQTTLNVDPLAAGIYFLKFNTEVGSTSEMIFITSD